MSSPAADGRGRGRLFVVSGPSGAGKGSVVRGVLRRRPDIYLSVSATTRPARAGEREEFLAARDRGEFLESAEVYGNLYGTPRRPVEQALTSGRDVICELDIQGALAVKRAVPDAVLIFVEPPSLEELYSRLRGRGTEEPDAVRRRVRAAYEEVRQKGAYDHIVVNDDLDRAIEEVLRILESSRNHTNPDPRKGSNAS